MRETRLFNDGWLFAETPLEDSSVEEIRKSATWKSVDLPHDWLIYDSRNLYREGVGWYRRLFKCENLKDHRILLCFDGVYMDCCLYVNGISIGEWKYGYTGFIFDITDYITEDENELLLRCTYQVPNSRWYTGAGIYRNVWLIRVHKHHIVPYGIYISTRKVGERFAVTINTQTSKSSGELIHRITDSQGQIVTEKHTSVSIKTNSDKSNGSDLMLIINDPKLWSPDSPYLYSLTTSLVVDGQLVDQVSQKIGLRTLQFNPDEGFFLNGEHMKIHGVCLHHDLGSLGAATNTAALRRQLLLLKKMGANAVRCAHNPFSPEFMCLCDELGLLVMSELLDMWEEPKTPYDYARFFQDWIEKDVESWVRRDRNHPSLFMWSAGNEIHDTHASPRGLKVLKYLISLIRRFDPMENAPITFCSNYLPWKNTQKCADLTRLIGYNYSEKYYAEHHAAHPDWIIFGSETGSLPQSRGIYHFPLSESLLSDDDMQCSSLGNSRSSWGAKSTEQCIIDDLNTKFSAGHFIWAGWDYLGEPTPYHSKSSFLGHIDTAGFPKDSFYIIQAEWSSFQNTPVVHIFPYWDFNDGQLIDVRVCTNAPLVELLLNGKSLGIQKLDHTHGNTLLGEWKIPYQKGELRAIAYDKNGNVVATDHRCSFSDAVKIVLDPDKTRLEADGRDLIFITVSMKDKDGHPVENANNRVHVSVEGAARLVGIDNGNSADYDSFKGTSMRLFSGKLLVILAAKTFSGPIRLTVSSPGIPDQELFLEAVNAIVPPGVSALEENSPRGNYPQHEIPVRKIRLQATRLALDRKNPCADVSYELFPVNATYRDVEWRITDIKGIDSHLATLEKTDTGVRVTALSDGKFTLRCATRNGGDAVYLYSALFFTAEGLGPATLDPYEYISGGLFTLSDGEIKNGNERGFATARDGDSYAGFENIDFGPLGSDEITIDVFNLDSDPLDIHIWEGEPGKKGGQLISTVRYHKPSIWNTYQPETFHLDKKLKGIKTLSFQLGRKAHIRGFYFRCPEKAFMRLFAGQCDNASGDSFKRNFREITSIGNNVSITFRDMDFGDKGTNKIVITGRTSLPFNTIQIRFCCHKTGEESIQLVEFRGNQDNTSYIEQEFTLERVTGKQDIHFVFLPGSRFDFLSFQFFQYTDS